VYCTGLGLPDTILIATMNCNNHSDVHLQQRLLVSICFRGEIGQKQGVGQPDLFGDGGHLSTSITNQRKRNIKLQKETNTGKLRLLYH
jgi:hypothetical protein